ncbi:DUF899 domain-containing protein [Thiomonas sp. FB-6]|uniref:DUF899 domain-containing protein n=1 Tax=Thiomonas sp. FB-6 TaxID=1158291 RepID=UPI00037F586D|nr:DUF899 domain-containing protein [Thiomonas sp. FB-6]
MELQRTVTREQWLDARLDLLAAEKDLTRHGDRVARLRRELPWVEIDKTYVFEGPEGRVALGDLFGARRQLLVQHFMLGPDWEEGCKGCSYMADHVDGMLVHLAQRDTAFVAVSRAPYARIERFRRRMGWRFPWVSSHGSSFNYDFGVSFTPEQVAAGPLPYNYGEWPLSGEDWPGVSVLFRDEAGRVFHSYSTYGRGVEVMMGAYRMLDLTPLGRGEREDAPNKMEWVRHHDRYEDAPASRPCCAAHDRAAPDSGHRA